MAKVLRVIASVLLILYIVIGLALFVPPLLGMTTAVADDQVVSNMETGSVAYALKTDLADLKADDRIVVTDENSVTVALAQSWDTTTGAVTATVENTDEVLELETGSYVQKVVLVVPYIGYVAIAMQTLEGRIVLLLIAAFLVVLVILFDALCRRKEADDEEDEEDEEESEGGTAGRTGSQVRPETAEPVSAEIPSAEAEQPQDPEGAAPAEGLLLAELDKTTVVGLTPDDMEADGGEEEEEDPWQKTVQAESREGDPASDEDAESETEPAEEAVSAATEGDMESEPAAETGAEGEAAEAELFIEPADGQEPQTEDPASDETEETDGGFAMPEVSLEETTAEEAKEAAEKAAAAAEKAAAEPMPMDPGIGTGSIPDVQAALEAALETQPMQHMARAAEQAVREETLPEQAAPEEIELAMPVYELEELLEQAYAQGADPQVRKDNIGDLTFVDYSNCL